MMLQALPTHQCPLEKILTTGYEENKDNKYIKLKIIFMPSKNKLIHLCKPGPKLHIRIIPKFPSFFNVK